MNQIDKFYDYLKELDESYGKLAVLLQSKMEAVAAGEHNKLDAIMKEEQVYVLMSKGFDTNLLDHREGLGLKGETLGAVIEELPEANRPAFRELHRHLKETLDQVQTLNSKCQAMIEDRLYALDRSIKALDKSEVGAYRKEGEGKNGPPEVKTTLFTKSI